MVIKNVEVTTGVRYSDKEEENRFIGKAIDTLTLKIPLPGGHASYELDLPKGMKESLDFAAQLSEKK